MRKGFNPAMLLDKKGNLFCIATGSDATSEHEWGSNELILELTGYDQHQAADVAKHIAAKRMSSIPNLAQTRKITVNLERICYVEKTVDGELNAILAFNGYEPERDVQPFENSFILRELNFSSFSDPKDIAGAWDASSFGFRVKGEKKVKQLREFAAAMREGKVMFAGSFLSSEGGQRLSGVILCREDLMRPEHRQALKDAQETFEAKVLLHQKARTTELEHLVMKTGKSFGYIWPVWADAVGGDVAYRVNPSYGVTLTESGPYSFERLSRLIQARSTATA